MSLSIYVLFAILKPSEFTEIINKFELLDRQINEPLGSYKRLGKEKVI
jgi:hypothetical protein